ncbi:MAG TPA: methionine synthase [Chloroflexi bacterium]|nr:methionine synthase [Chloroflexota bacterium]
MTDQMLPNCRATGIGSTPHTDTTTAVNFVLAHFKEVPFWPQLPRRTFMENMYVQYTEYMPGICLDMEEERISVLLDDAWLDQAEPFYAAFLEEDPNCFALGDDYAAGFHEVVKRGVLDAWAVKGHVTGPISLGFQIIDQNLRPSLYDDMMRDVLIKNVLRHAQWQEAQLRALCPRTIVSIDEPCLSMFGSAYAAISREDVVGALEEIFSGLQGWTGTHCCGNTDWSLLMETSVDILFFDAFEYTEYLALYPNELRAFLDRGGMLGWGVVPNKGEVAETITLDGAGEIFESALARLEQKGFDRQELLPRSLITPACGTGPLTVPVAERVMRLTCELSDRVRASYQLGE